MKKRFVRIVYYLIICLLFQASISSCGNSNNDADAYGNFEADEIIVSAQSQGIIFYMKLNEGDVLEENQKVGIIDTTTVEIKLGQLSAQRTVIDARLKNLDAQLKVQDEQHINLAREVERIEKLLVDQAATQQQYDDMKGKLNVLDCQTEALETQKNIIFGEKSVLTQQMNEVYNMLEKCRIVNPVHGTVLEKYAEAGELVSPGKALYKIADIREMELRVYISGSQLSSVAIGDTVSVVIDTPDEGSDNLSGIVSWISSEVEFTPKIIQTREERVNMVYAIKVRVKNDGRLKIGMPGEVVFRKK